MAPVKLYTKYSGYSGVRFSAWNSFRSPSNETDTSERSFVSELRYSCVDNCPCCWLPTQQFELQVSINSTWPVHCAVTSTLESHLDLSESFIGSSSFDSKVIQ